MRELRQGLTALVAIFAITLHSLLVTLSPQIAVAAADQFDPASIICLSGHGAGVPGNPDTPATQHNCQQCVMCVAPALAGADQVALVWEPTPAGSIEPPPSEPDHFLVRHGPQLPRGPPLTA